VNVPEIVQISIQTLLPKLQLYATIKTNKRLFGNKLWQFQLVAPLKGAAE